MSFSGGKDSTVLMDIARRIYPDIPAVFSNTGLEYPEIQKFVKSYDNVDIIVPEMRFDQVVSTYGYPLIGKEVAHAIYYSRRIRNSNKQDKEMQFRRHHFGSTKRDRLSGNVETTLFDYHKWLPIVELPFMITHYCCSRTGCVFCGFGFHLDKGETRFQRLARTHPRQYEYAIGGGQWVDNPAYDPTAPEYDGEWKNWNPKQIWVPSKKGLGMGKVFDMVNEVYGKNFYRYE